MAELRAPFLPRRRRTGRGRRLGRKYFPPTAKGACPGGRPQASRGMSAKDGTPVTCKARRCTTHPTDVRAHAQGDDHKGRQRIAPDPPPPRLHSDRVPCRSGPSHVPRRRPPQAPARPIPSRSRRDQTPPQQCTAAQPPAHTRTLACVCECAEANGSGQGAPPPPLQERSPFLHRTFQARSVYKQHQPLVRAWGSAARAVRGHCRTQRLSCTLSSTPDSLPPVRASPGSRRERECAQVGSSVHEGAG